MATKKQQKEQVSPAEKMYLDACGALGVLPKTLDDFKTLFDDDEKEAAWHYHLHRIARVVMARKAGHEFDWNNDDEYKYSPWFDMETYGEAPSGSGFAFGASGYVRTYSHVGSRLSSKTEEDCTEIAKTMMDDYKVVFKD